MIKETINPLWTNQTHSTSTSCHTKKINLMPLKEELDRVIPELPTQWTHIPLFLNHMQPPQMFPNTSLNKNRTKNLTFNKNFPHQLPYFYLVDSNHYPIILCHYKKILLNDEKVVIKSFKFC